MTTAPAGPPKRRAPLYLALAAVVAVVIAVAGYLWLRGPQSGDRITVAATQVPHAEILEFVRNGPAKEAGLDFDIRVFDDYSLGNRWLAEGDIDAKLFPAQAVLR